MAFFRQEKDQKVKIQHLIGLTKATQNIHISSPIVKAKVVKMSLETSLLKHLKKNLMLEKPTCNDADISMILSNV